MSLYPANMARFILALLIFPLCAFSPGTGAAQESIDPLILAYDKMLLEKFRAYKGNSKSLIKGDLAKVAKEAALLVFTENSTKDDWQILRDYGDQKLAKMPFRAPSHYKDRAVHKQFLNGEMAVGLRAAGLGERAAFRMWDPEKAISAIGQTGIGTFLNAEELATNAVISGVTSSEIFRTNWRGSPAVGQDMGLWTAVMAYERDSQGGFLPLGIGIFER